MSEYSWRGNLGRTGGFYQDADWYSANLRRKMPLVGKMMEELVAALPPLGDSKVLDLLGGAGQATRVVLEAYPRARVSLLERCPQRVAQCEEALARMVPPKNLQAVFQQEVDICNPSGADLPGGPYNLIVATLALHTLVGHQAQDEERIRTRYKAALEALLRVLEPGGHLIIGDHVGTWGLYRQVRMMEEVGFTEVDVAWRQDGFFVAGGRKCLKELTEGNK